VQVIGHHCSGIRYSAGRRGQWAQIPLTAVKPIVTVPRKEELDNRDAKVK